MRMTRWLGTLSRNRIDFQARDLWYAASYNDGSNAIGAGWKIINTSTRGTFIGVYALAVYNRQPPHLMSVSETSLQPNSPSVALLPLYQGAAAIEAGFWSGEDLDNQPKVNYLDARNLRWQHFGGAPMYIIPPSGLLLIQIVTDGNYQVLNNSTNIFQALIGEWKER